MALFLHRSYCARNSSTGKKTRLQLCPLCHRESYPSALHNLAGSYCFSFRFRPPNNGLVRTRHKVPGPVSHCVRHHRCPRRYAPNVTYWLPGVASTRRAVRFHRSHRTGWRNADAQQGGSRVQVPAAVVVSLFMVSFRGHLPVTASVRRENNYG